MNRIPDFPLNKPPQNIAVNENLLAELTGEAITELRHLRQQAKKIRDLLPGIAQPVNLVDAVCEALTISRQHAEDNKQQKEK